ncbi:hypothetical protein KP509_10G011200 [Ceratopteris richardii]|uniref:Uncharacterized protein n=1 Tax=Ceratopteris richardii TaxID=49495 RepID=A0A8T2TYD4_CERRI|nr:hypothetical protein KP509_10G011200 [Ceratopteris richardii]KAH7426667.1 hypothetical protein KP509_10G011200 [Ceratopteris richardii]
MSKPKHEPKATPLAAPQEVEALPCFPIRWTAYGIYLESAESTLNHQNIVQFVNQITLPHLNLVAIDVLDLVEQEIRASTDLGLRLKCTKQDSNEKKKEADRQKWIPPAALLLEAIHKRISMDRDIEHKKEDARRKKDIEDAKAELEATSVNLKKAQEEFVSAEKALKMFNSGIIEPKEDVEKPKAPATTKKGTAAAKVEKEKSTATNSGKPKAAKDILKPEENNVLEDDTKQKLVTSLTEAKLRYQEMEKKAKMAVSCLKKKESSRLERYSLVQVYILLGLPNNPSFIASLGDGDKKIMCAILNLKASHIHEEIKISEQMSSKEGKSGNGENTLSKSLAVELKALARTSGINDPSRQIAIIDVEYENVISDEMKGLQEEKDTVGNEKKKGKPKIKDVEGTLPYKSIAKALAEALQNFSLALIAYKNMMRKIQFTKVPHAVGFEDIDTTYYKQLLSEVPTNFLNVPVILHCVLEQVALNSVADTELKENCLKGEEKNVKNYLEKKFLNFGRNSPGSAKDSQDKDMSKETCSRHSSSGSDVSAEHVFLLEKRIELLGSRENVHILHDFDLIEKEAIIFSSSQVLSLPSGTVIDATEVSKHMARLLPFPGHQRQGMPKVALLSQEERGTLVSKILNDGRYSLSAVQLHQKLKKLKDALFMAENSNVLLEALQLQNFLQSVRKSQFMELYPDCLATEAYVKAKLTRGFERVIYDEMEDCIVSLLYAADGMYEWKYSIPFQIPFADFVDKHLDLESFTVAPRAYGISENKSQLYEKRFFYLSEDGSLFSFGLPSISESVKEPQGTLHMDGNTFVLRPSKSNNMSNMELTACFGDGLIACFFPGGNGLINIQLTTPEGNTIEMNYDGIVHMLDTYANKDSEMNFDQLKIVNDKRTTEENNTLHYEDSFLCSTKAEEDSDSWRCILPSGSLLCGRKSGELVAMFPNGNVSHYKKLKSQSFQWTTTNSSGYQVIQESRDTRHLNQNDILQNVEVNMDEVQKTGPKSSKDQKQTKKDNSGSLPLPKGTPGKKNKVAAEPNLGSTNSQKSESPSISAADPPENTTEKDFPKLISDDPSKPLLYMLPKKRMVCMKDSLTNCCIESREDLVTVVRFPEGEQIALHSDGTHIYTKSFRSESSASIMNTSTPADNSGECSSDVEKKEALIDQIQLLLM